MHLDRETREKLFSAFSAMDSISDLEKIDGMKELFGSKEWGWMKAAGTNIEKCFKHLAKRLDQDELQKFISLINHNVVLVISRSDKGKEKPSLSIHPKHLWDLGELAIANHCTGCQIKKYKACQVYTKLMKACIPAAQNTSTDCPYRQ